MSYIILQEVLEKLFTLVFCRYTLKLIKMKEKSASKSFQEFHLIELIIRNEGKSINGKTNLVNHIGNDI